MNGKEKITEMVEVFKKQKEEFTEKMKGEFNNFFKEFFAINSDISQVQWTQYTSYFNDGEPTYFSTHFYDVLRLDEDMPKEEYERLKEIESELEDLLNSIPGEIYKDMFGDHVEVTATADGFDVSEYSNHD